MGSTPIPGSMSRSYKKEIGFGKSTYGCASRTKKTYADYANERRRKKGLPLFKQHFRSDMQTLEDYIDWIKRDFEPRGYVICHHNVYYKIYQEWLKGREETEELIREYARKLYNRDKAK